MLRLSFPWLTAVVVGVVVGCSKPAADVSEPIHTSLDLAGYKDVSVSQDRDKGVVTLSGRVQAERDKSRADSIARSIAVGQVVANEIAVIPPRIEVKAKKINSAFDSGIEHNLQAALTKAGLRKGVKYSVKSQVVTLRGKVSSQSKRGRVQHIAAAIPHVRQVVNELQVKGQKATESRNRR